MCLPIGTYDPRPVYRKYNRQILYTYIMQYLIICPLQERRIYCNYRSETACRQSCCKCRGSSAAWYW